MHKLSKSYWSMLKTHYIVSMRETKGHVMSVEDGSYLQLVNNIPFFWKDFENYYSKLVKVR